MSTMASRTRSRRLWLFFLTTLSIVLTAYWADQRSGWGPSGLSFDVPWRTYLDQWRDSNTCPRPDRPRSSLPLAYTADQCLTPALSENATAADPAWSVSVCHKPSRCNAVSVFITARDPSMCELDRRLSRDDTVHAGFASFGPAEFHAQVLGAEKYIVSTGGPSSTYDEELCQYRLDVALQSSGRAEMQVWMFHEEWQAVDEFYETWPPQLRLPIFAEPYQFPACAETCHQTYAPLNVLPDDGDMEPFPTHILSALPTCSPESVNYTHQGSYLASVPDNHFFDLYPATRPYKPKHEPGQYRFQPQDCLLRHTGLNFADHKSCVEQEKSVLIIGDSHGRVLYDAMVWRLGGNRIPCIYSAKAGNKNTTIDNTFFNCIWDPRAGVINKMPCEELAEYDAIIVSVGSHHAGNAPTTEYLASLEFFERLSQCGANAQMVFATPPPQPPRQDEHVEKFKDHRTISRLTYWGQLAAEKAQSAGWKVIDLMGLLRPFMFDPLATDLAHYLDTDGLEAVMDQLLAQVDLCGPAEVDAPGPFIEE